MSESKHTPGQIGWALETMQLINDLTPDIKGKAFNPDWFLLRQRLEQYEQECAELLAACKTIVALNAALDGLELEYKAALEIKAHILPAMLAIARAERGSK